MATTTTARAVVAAIALLGLLLGVSAGNAKEFKPGELRVCGRARCVPIMNARVVRILNAYYWDAGRAPRAHRVPTGAPGFELRFGGPDATGMVAPARLDRFRAYGFNCGRFQRGRWYRFPLRAARELRRLTTGIRPLRVSTPPPSC
jgi:hypothetical protein